MKTKFNPVVAQATQDKIAGDALKKTAIPAGHVRFERHDYSYGQQGQVTLIGYTCKDIPENEAFKWVHYGMSTVTWPDGDCEFFDTRVTPCKHDGKGYGTITRDDGKQVTGTLSRLPNVFVEYYGPRGLSESERKTFVPYVFQY